MGNYMNFLFNPNGRVSRSDIWLKYVLVSVIASIVASGLDLALGMAETGPLGAVVSLFFLWPGIAVSIKRFHDRGMTGWWVLFVYLVVLGGLGVMVWPVFNNSEVLASVEAGDLEALSDVAPTMLIIGALMIFAAGLFAFVVNYCLAGEKGLNEYGPDPLAGTESAFE